MNKDIDELLPSLYRYIVLSKRIEDADGTRWSLVACVISCRLLATLGLCEAPASTRAPKAAWGMASSSIAQGGLR